MIEPGLEKLAKHRRKEQEKMRLLREVAELFKTNWPTGKGDNLTASVSKKRADSLKSCQNSCVSR